MNGRKRTWRSECREEERARNKVEEDGKQLVRSSIVTENGNMKKTAITAIDMYRLGMGGGGGGAKSGLSCVCVCVRACVCERERGGGESDRQAVFLLYKM